LLIFIGWLRIASLLNANWAQGSTSTSFNTTVPVALGHSGLVASNRIEDQGDNERNPCKGAERSGGGSCAVDGPVEASIIVDATEGEANTTVKDGEDSGPESETRPRAEPPEDREAFEAEEEPFEVKVRGEFGNENDGGKKYQRVYTSKDRETWTPADYVATNFVGFGYGYDGADEHDERENHLRIT